jgi:hypothetical protein
MKTTITLAATFGREGNSTEYQLYGWHLGETGFTWALGEESALMFPVPAAPHGYFIDCLASPHFRSETPRTQRISLSVNGLSLGYADLTAGCPLAFFAPPANTLDRRIVLRIHHPDTHLAFKYVRILTLEKPPISPTGRISREPLPGDDSVVAGQLAPWLEAVAGLSARDLVMKFEILSGDCTFGGVQRHFEAEPLSLLRFAGCTPELAVRGMDTGFAGMGGVLEPFVSSDAREEWMMHDKGFGLRWHTGRLSRDVSEADIIRTERVKSAFLVRKFMQDLADGEKTYLVADRWDLPDQAMIAVFLALLRHGPNRLLWIKQTADRAKSGHVEELYPGLMRGYIEDMSGFGGIRPKSLHGWVHVLTNACLLQQSAEI